MADDFYLKLNGKVQGEMKGESEKTGKEGQTQLLGFSFGASQPGTYGMHGGGSHGRVEFTDITFSASFNSQSVKVFESIGNHEVLTEVVLTGRKGTGDKQDDWITITLTNAVMTNYHASFSDGGHVSGNLNYEKIEISYKPQINESGDLGTAVPYAFDQKTGQKA
jgi:type VI secretion system secreted protein Hcp